MLMGGLLEDDLKLPRLLSAERTSIEGYCATLLSELVDCERSFALELQGDKRISYDAFSHITSQIESIQESLEQVRLRITDLSKRWQEEMKILRLKRRDAKQPGVTEKNRGNQKQMRIKPSLSPADELPHRQSARCHPQQQQHHATISTTDKTDPMAQPQHHSAVLPDLTTKSVVAGAPLPTLPSHPSDNTHATFHTATVGQQHSSSLSSSTKLLTSSQVPSHPQPPSLQQSQPEEKMKKQMRDIHRHVMSGVFKDLPTATTGSSPNVASTTSRRQKGSSGQTTGKAESQLETNAEDTDPTVASTGKLSKKRRSSGESRTLGGDLSRGKKRRSSDGESGSKGGKKTGAGRKKVGKERRRGADSSGNSNSAFVAAVAPLDQVVITEDVTVTVTDRREEEEGNATSHVFSATPAEKRSFGKVKRDNGRAVEKSSGKKVRRDNRRDSDERSAGKKAKQDKCQSVGEDADAGSSSCLNIIQNDDGSGVQGVVVNHASAEKCDSAEATTSAEHKKKELEVRIEDQYPLRITNPLLELPQYPHLPRGAAPSSLPVELIPQGAELWNLCEVYFPHPDTYPISYLARLLGFEVPAVKPLSKMQEGREESSLAKFDPATLRLSSKARGSGPSSTDPWFNIPPLGNFAEQVWKRRRKGKRNPPISFECNISSRQERMGDSDDEALDYIDPMWCTIMSNYRGYDDAYFNPAPATSFGQAPKRPPGEECLVFAREREILGDGISFRFAKIGDENLLSSINKKSRYLNSRDAYTVSLRSPSHFFVVAESENCSPLGFIHYSFNWYRLQGPGARRAESNDMSKAVSEMVIFIGDMQCSDQLSRETCDVGNIEGKGVVSSSDISEGQGKNCTRKNGINPTEDTSTQQSEQKDGEGKIKKATSTISLSIVLTSLALEHARLCNIWYGMLEVERATVPFFTRYFRMTVVPQSLSRSGVIDDGLLPLIPLVCDLKKCGYRYAILLKKEDDESPTHPQVLATAAEVREAKQRLLIRMPSVGEATPYFCVSEAKCGMSQRNAVAKKKKQNYLSFSNPKEEVQSKTVKIRLELGNSNLFQNDKPPEIKLSTLDDSIEDGKTLLGGIPRELSSNEPSWEVLRSFPIDLSTNACSDKKVRAGSASALALQTGEGTLLRELEKKQRELTDTETRLEPQVRHLLHKYFEERVQFESEDAVEKRKSDMLTLKEYDAVLERRREADLAWQAQLEQDMDAVCDICGDGEVTVDNQILFCEACNVAVHQKCYGIDSVPAGDYFCLACRFFNRDKMKAMPSRHFDGESAPPKLMPSPLPICCELCPRKQGAFVRTFFEPKRTKKRKGDPVAKWVHVVCAKWQGLRYIDQEKKDLIEDVTELKGLFRANDLKCCICQGFRGAVNRCRVEGCKSYMHVTCARACGLCIVCHGENHTGLIETEAPWTLVCPEHSNVLPENVPEGSLTIDQLVAAAKAFPPEPLPEPPKPDPKPFNKMNGKERKEFLSDPEFEEELIQKIKSGIVGSSCAICDTRDDEEEAKNSLTKCAKCFETFHRKCLDDCKNISDKIEDESLCDGCKYVAENEDNEDFEVPQCHMCNQEGGILKKAFAKPTSKKFWRTKHQAFKKSLFGKQIWCHAICGMWHPQCKYLGAENGAVDCSAIIMANGQSHIDSKKACALCGRCDKVKVQCHHPGCVNPRYPKNGPFRFHLTCARQAGFEVSDAETQKKEIVFQTKCFHHARCECAFRAKLEDFIEPEKIRAGNDLKNSNLPMTFSHATKLLHLGVTVLRILGWAWIWAEWWVEKGDRWEPLLDIGQKEEDMTREELGYVDSTQRSRCADARKCRLAAFGAALRNRDYDEEEDGGRVALDRALRAILHTQSLVGRLRRVEIDFFADWLGRAYRSRSPLLGFGDNKIPVADSGHCLHTEDGSAKYKLGSRPLPGKQELPKNTFFENGFEEPDDFLKFVTLDEEKNTQRKIKNKLIIKEK